MRVNGITGLWNSRHAEDWRQSLSHYWNLVSRANLDVEKEFEQLNPDEIRLLDQCGWYEFLLRKYFPWKYTARNRLATTTKHLKKYDETDSLSVLWEIKHRLFNFDKVDISTGLKIATEIKGLGPPGASGLLAVLFPRHFGTVDQFAVKALRQVDGLPESAPLLRMNPDSLRHQDAVTLIQIMRNKAQDLNSIFSSDEWTPRKIDKILWGFGR